LSACSSTPSPCLRCAATLVPAPPHPQRWGAQPRPLPIPPAPDAKCSPQRCPGFGAPSRSCRSHRSQRMSSNKDGGMGKKVRNKKIRLMTDCTYRRKTLQLSIAWDVELCHLQYAYCFNSSSGGIAWDNLIYSILKWFIENMIIFRNIKSKFYFILPILLSRHEWRTCAWFSLRWPNKFGGIHLRSSPFELSES